MVRVVIVLVCLAVSFESPAYAYIDPATGGAIASAVIGAFVALGVWFKTQWYRVKRLFRRRQSDD